MVKYELRIEKQKIFGAEKIAIAADANETVSLRFYFDSNWRIFDAKAAIFRTAENRYYIIEIKGSTVTVPWEVLTVDRDFELSVIGYDGATVLTAGKVDIRVVSSLLPEDCKTFSPSETLFDRIKQDSIAEAFKKYEDELDAQKNSYEKKLVEMGTQINKANENTKDVENAKNEEIKSIRQEHAEEVVNLNAEIAKLKSDYAAAKAKADNWDLVDEAMSDKTMSNFAPWTGGTKEFKLPFFNTKSMNNFSSGNFSTYITEIGLDFSSSTTLNQLFCKKNSLRKIELRNTDKVTSAYSAFSASTSLREVILGNLTSCIEINYAFSGDTSLEKVTIGEIVRIGDFNNMFNGCIALREINCTLNMIGANKTENMFAKCSSLKEVRFKAESIPLSLSLADCQALSRESILSVVEGLAVVEKNALTLSKYAFDNAFPTQEEQAEVKNTVTQKKWRLVLS